MKKHKSMIRSQFWIAILFFVIPLLAQAQQGQKAKGVVLDTEGLEIIGASVIIKGTSTGTITDVDGRFELNAPNGATLVVTFVGYQEQEVLVSGGKDLLVKLKENDKLLDEVVVIGYGTQRKGDLTGAISSVNSKDFNEGLVSSPEQLINGKVSGVQIMSNSGSPTGGSTIRIRGGASLNASNDPLIVLDGVPLENGGISGNTGNFLSLINPNDIESMTILKDASSTAIYGSRASNGVVIITTKKGSDGGLKFSFNTTNSLQTRLKTADVLSRNEFHNLITTQGTSKQQNLLQSHSTNWNDEIYRTAYGTDNNFSVAGKIAPNWPIRASVGYYNQDGVVRTDNAERMTGSLMLNPNFLENQLQVALNAKGSVNNNRFANTGAIWAAATFNPTLPIYQENNRFGGYYEDADVENPPVNGGVRNPLGMLKQYDSTSKVYRIIGNADVDYKMHFLPELKFHATVGYDYAEGKGNVYAPAESAEYYTTKGRDYKYGPQKNSNKLLTTYLNYNKKFEEIKSQVDATLGYDYQYWKTTTPTYSELNTEGDIQTTSAAKDQRHSLISYYARLNYTYDTRYTLTGTVRGDGTSRFHKDNRWGTFPSVALAWRMSEEEFMKNYNDVLSNLKLRASFGVTGQQEGIGNYNYLPVYTYSQNGAQVQFGDQWYYSYRPEAYVEGLKWETTTSWNFGLDFGFIKDRLSGSVDFYTRSTKDLLATVPSPAGVNFDKNILTNVGNVDSHGIEFSLNATPIDTKDLTWDMSFNMSWQKMKVKNLSLIDGGAATNTLVGPTIDSYQFQLLSENYEPYMFYVYHQLYDEKTGKPIEGAYADLNNDGQINSEDLYRYKSPAPDFIFGFSTSVRYKKWSLSTSLRANVGNYVYNGTAMNTGAWGTVSYNDYQLNNVSSSYLKTGFNSRQYLSDYYVENASFLKMDNLTLGYNFGKVNNWFGLKVNAMVQNVFCITKYSGVDPEVPNGVDMSFYPRPRIYSIGIGLDF